MEGCLFVSLHLSSSCTSIWPNYGTAIDVFAFLALIRYAGAIIRTAIQKAKGSWSGAITSAFMALISSSNATPQEFAKEHPRFFVREIHKGSSWKYQKLK
jgi:carbon starvation protein CstA